MLIDTKHARSAHSNMKGQQQQTHYASSKELIVSYKCSAYIKMACGMRYNTDTAWQLVDNVSTACITCSQQILRVSTTLSQHINVPIQLPRQESITKMNTSMHMHPCTFRTTLEISRFRFQQRLTVITSDATQRKCGSKLSSIIKWSPARSG